MRAMLCVSNDFLGSLAEHIPPGSRLVANMVKPKEMHDHAIPIIIFQLIGDMPRHIIVHFSKVLK